MKSKLICYLKKNFHQINVLLVLGGASSVAVPLKPIIKTRTPTKIGTTDTFQRFISTPVVVTAANVSPLSKLQVCTFPLKMENEHY